MQGYYTSAPTFYSDHPTGEAGDIWLVEGDLISWNTENNKWENMGLLIGPAGATGAISVF